MEKFDCRGWSRVAPASVICLTKRVPTRRERHGSNKHSMTFMEAGKTDGRGGDSVGGGHEALTQTENRTALNSN